jgi:hypothetical protein
MMGIALIPGLSPITPLTSVLPLLFVITVTGVKQGAVNQSCVPLSSNNQLVVLRFFALFLHFLQRATSTQASFIGNISSQRGCTCSTSSVKDCCSFTSARNRICNKPPYSGVEDYYRYRADCQVNQRLHAVVSHKGGVASISPVECHSIRVGDLVRVRDT